MWWQGRVTLKLNAREFRTCTLASIKPETSQAPQGEICVSDYAKILCTGITTEPHHPSQSSRSALKASSRRPCQAKACPLCKQVGHQEARHLLSEGGDFPDNDRRYIVRGRQILGIIKGESYTQEDPGGSACLLTTWRVEQPTVFGLVSLHTLMERRGW